MIPPGMLVCHRCDNPPCVNVEHLFVGTVSDNAKDMLAKGRGNRKRGAENANSKLRENSIHRIRILRGVLSQEKLATIFGVTQVAIRKILIGDAWKHVKGRSSI